MRTLPEICEFCKRKVRALERVFVLLTGDEKRAARVTFRKSVEGVRCMYCVPEESAEGAVARGQECRYARGVLCDREGCA